jgi:UDPglucose 6-dehydrogenase
VGTPSAADGSPDLSAVEAVAKLIARGIDSYKVVVNKSTVPVGSGGFVSDIICSQGVGSDLFDVVSNPEFLREGSAISDTLHPDRIVIGATNRAAAAILQELYEPLQAPFILTDVASAELIKYASNAFLATKISFINAMSRICELTGGDIGAVSTGVGADARIGKHFLQAGLGWGGSCFPKDVSGLIKIAEGLGYDFDLLKAVTAINEDQTLHFVRRLEKKLGGLAGKTIGLLGLSFKPNTDDLRDAKSLVIIEAILKAGGSIRAHDPVAAELVQKIYPSVEMTGIYEVAEGADALVLVTEWNEYRQLDLARLGEKMKSRILFDGRRVYSSAAVKEAGFEYATIGS